MVAWIWATGMLGSNTITFGPKGAAVGAALAPPPPTSATNTSGRARNVLDRAMGSPSCSTARRGVDTRCGGRRNGAAPESNRASRGLHDLTGFEDRLGHRALPLRPRA